ncbi:MAG TPA: hypothetical protein VKY31_12780 [Terriglobia bacterium]|nr:hypothetical protein [Terriglobia bacterium]
MKIWWTHLQTFLWLYARIRANRTKRAATGSIIVEWILNLLTLFAAATTFVAGFLVGALALRQVHATTIMFVWDGIAAFFLFFWMIELVNELQRSEILSLQNFFHLPVGLSSVFAINYVASLFTLATSLFAPLMAGLSAGLVVSRGPTMLLLFPLVAAFLLMITALTYQLRGWLASLMENKRRRRTVITAVTIVMILIFQIPNLLRFYTFGNGNRREAPAIQREQVEKMFRKANAFIPLGWLPYGATALIDGRVAPSLLATFGMTLIGAASLRRSYRTTLRLYTGQFKARKPRQPAGNVVRKPIAGNAAFLERRIPWVSEHVSAIAVASFRSLTRAPEAKMMLLTPLIFTLVFGSTFLRTHANPAELVRPIMASGLMAFILLGLAQLAGNQFGFDRSGFRVFVLAGAPRSDILMGKNLALLPIALGLGLIGTVALQFAFPMHIDHFIAALLQMASMYLAYCLVLNLLSVLAPSAIAQGTLRPVRLKGLAVLVHLLFFFFILPIALGVTLIPLGFEFLLKFPVYLPLSVLEFVAILYLYPRALVLQGQLLQTREQRILEIVAAKAE